MSDTVIERDEIMLYGQRFPSLGPVRRTAVTPFAPKFTQGDYTRDDKIVVSSWVFSSAAGGLGISNAVFPRDLDRIEESTLSTPYKFISLNPYVYTAGAIGGKADLLIEYNGFLYGSVGSTVYSYSVSTNTWTSEHTISGTANASAIFNGEMYIITDSGLHRYNAVTDTWTDYASPDAYIPNGDAIIEWDNKLFRIGPDPADSSLTKMYWTINPDANSDGASAATDWTEAGTLHLPRKYCQQLIIYFDLTGEPVIHAITKIGVYGYSFEQATFVLTPLTFPATAGAGRGAIVWRGELYVPVGVDVYKYNGSTIQVVGPSKDDGLPTNLRGNILQLVSGHSFYYGIISTAIEGGANIPDMQFYTDATPDSGELVLYEENPLIGAFPLGSASTTGAVLQSTGTSWHSVFNVDIGNTMGYSLVASVEDTFRLWIATDTDVYYINLNTGLHNPLQNPTTEFRDEGYLITPWVDLGWVELDKLALSLDVDAEGLNTVDGTYIGIDLAFDGSESWVEYANVTENGLTQYLIGGELGIVFRRIKMRLRFYRGPDNIRATPVLKHVIFGFVRRPHLLWGWDVDIPVTDIVFYGKTADELVDAIYRIARTETAGRFIYRNRITGEQKDHRVLVTNVRGAEVTGDTSLARYTISLIQLDEII